MLGLLAAHGGGCCGLRHLRGFSCKPSFRAQRWTLEDKYEATGPTALEVLDTRLAELDKMSGASTTVGKTLQIVLTHAQTVQYSEWLPLLKERGFRHIDTIRN